MKHYTFKELKKSGLTDTQLKRLDKGKNETGEVMVCECGSTTLFFAPIVNIRCSKCIKPL